MNNITNNKQHDSEVRSSYVEYNIPEISENLKYDYDKENLSSKSCELRTVATPTKANILTCQGYLRMRDKKLFTVKKILPDGNCFYRAVADQLTELRLKNINNDNYNYEDLKKASINYINENKDQEFGQDLYMRLCGPELRGDLPSDIYTIDDYITYHNQPNVWADSGTIGALAQSLSITLRVYNNSVPATYNAGQKESNTINLLYTGDHYDSLMIVFEPIQVLDASDLAKLFDQPSYKYDYVNNKDKFDSLVSSTISDYEVVDDQDIPDAEACTRELNYYSGEEPNNKDEISPEATLKYDNYLTAELVLMSSQEYCVDLSGSGSCLNELVSTSGTNDLNLNGVPYHPCSEFDAPTL